MRRAIHFDRQFPVRAVKIEDELAYRMLAPEPEAIELAAAKVFPKEDLGQGHFLPHSAGTVVGFS
jgi:hypothetical protein